MIFTVFSLLFLAVTGIMDIKDKSISKKLLFADGIVSVLCAFFQLYYGTTVYALAASLFPGAFFLALAYLTREKIGYGDGYVILFLGPVFGLTGILIGCVGALFLSAICSIGLLCLRKANKNTQLPFLPFLAAGMGAVYAVSFIG